ncbi:hypothetical protein BG842_10045 [Haladaptatus sp. W1]|uniref:DUF3267 domain-containing protein n=1 Tax=Haladaptatus sp. W1 TaxID=1897478 RepID=UPI000849CE5D|nr:DUF3267 domain-containing protein [Haladaptatus sp. W1]ODR83339.1 hypothetical protein BG842_10045 [Haladaptatus sp. W1]
MTAPSPPAGYCPPERFRYSSAFLALASLVAFVVSVVGFGALLWFLQGTPEGGSVSFGFAGVVAVFLVCLATLVVHEAIHGLVFRWLGYRVSFGFAPHVPALYTAAFGQFVTRRDNLLTGVAPLVVITAVAVPLLAAPLPVASVAYLVLLVNTSGAVGDVYMSWRLWRLPPETLFYDVDIEHSYAFEPANDTAIGAE